MVPGENVTEEFKRQHQALKTSSVKSRIESTDSTLPSDLLRSVNQETMVRARGLPQCLLSTLCVEGIICPCLTYQGSVFVVRGKTPVMQKGRVRGAETR